MGRAAEAMRELASGIDALYLSGHGLASPGLLQELEAHRLAANEHGESVPISLGDGCWSIEPHGLVRYRYRLKHENGLMGVTDKDSLPRLRIQPRSEFLHAIGVRRALAWFQSQAEEAVPDVRLTGSRLDVYADWQGWTVGASSTNPLRMPRGPLEHA